jgi:FkbM family methyltransferase
VTAVTTTYALTESGRRIYVDPDDPRAARLVAAHGDLNPNSLVLWQRALDAHPWDLVVDVGVNYGEMLVGARLPEAATLVGFEPNLALHSHLRRTLDEGGLAVDLRAHAISDAPGTARFAIDGRWSGTSSLDAGGHEDESRWQLVDVEVTTLDEVVGPDAGSFCVKVDVEGFERQVVDGARSTLAQTPAWALMLEVAHMSRLLVAQLAEDFAMFLMDLRTHRLLRVPGGNATVATRMLSSGWLYQHDCLVTSDEIARKLETNT